MSSLCTVTYVTAVHNWHVHYSCVATDPEDSSIVSITECSVQHLTFTLTEALNINCVYWFLAACKNNGTCVSVCVCVHACVCECVCV